MNIDQIFAIELAYHNKKQHAVSIGEEFHLDYETFYQAWTHKARWHFRKPGWDGLVMTKLDHSKPYSNDNILITTRLNSKMKARELGMKKGSKHTEETLEKMRGQKKSDETKMKMAAAKLGKKRGPYKKKNKDIETLDRITAALAAGKIQIFDAREETPTILSEYPFFVKLEYSVSHTQYLKLRDECVEWLSFQEIEYWIGHGDRYRFKDDTDAMAFKLMWA